MAEPLPEFVPPMLARQGKPFDSDDHLFEIKWDGTRAQVRIEGGGYSLTNRRRRSLTGRYPELGFFADLQPGLLLDGEIVVLAQGKPRFKLMLQREQARNDLRIQTLSRSIPATYVVFDVLYRDGESLLRRPLSERREVLAEVVEQNPQKRLLLSEGVVGSGEEYFAAVTARDLEGVMAKRLSSRYEPGRRTDDWLKIKQTHRLHCAIVGFTSEGDDVRSLVIAAQMDGALRCVGRVGSGLTAAMRDRLGELLPARVRETPFLECDVDGVWVEPGLYCIVSYLELTEALHLRAPVFLDLIVDDDEDTYG